MPFRRLLTLLAALLVAAPAWAEQLKPFDEGPSRPGFADFRARMTEAVEARDRAFLRAHTAPDIKWSFGADNGRDTFMATIEENPELWGELRWVLEHGGAFDENGDFIAPYTYAADTGMDPFRAGIVTGSDVNVRASPDTNALAIERLSHEVVEVETWGLGRGDRWARIALPGGGHGFMVTDYLRSPIDYRARFAQRDGTWVMEMFVAGD